MRFLPELTEEEQNLLVQQIDTVIEMDQMTANIEHPITTSTAAQTLGAKLKHLVKPTTGTKTTHTNLPTSSSQNLLLGSSNYDGTDDSQDGADEVRCTTAKHRLRLVSS